MEKISLENGEGKKEFSELLEIVQKMESISEDETISPEEFAIASKILVEQLLEHLNSDLHYELSSEINSLYAEMARENLLARVENVTTVMECVLTGKPILVGHGKSNYANSVTANPEGLRIAMAEADAFGPVRLLVGLDLKTLIGFSNDHIKVSEIDNDSFDIRDTSLRKNHCRHIEGEIHREDIKYMVMRIPRRYFPDKKMSQIEASGSEQFIFRGAKLSRDIQGESSQIAA